MADIMKLLAPQIKQINEAMLDLIRRDEKVVARVGSYSFEGGGKRLRPIIFCLILEALGRKPDREMIEVSSAFEFLHMATLLHDDIIDCAELRRGQAAAHLVFGVPEVILAGDYLLAKAANLGATTGNMDCVKIMSEVVAALSLGELIQLESRHKVDLAEDDYFKIIYRKTASLIEGAASAASILAGAEGETLAAAARYGRQFGLAFQITDDILDYQGNEAAFGKPIGHDLDEGKITLPFIKAREALGDDRRVRLCEMADREDISPAEHEEIILLVNEGGGIESARLKADELAHEAVTALAFFPPSPARDKLEALAIYIVSREH